MRMDLFFSRLCILLHVQVDIHLQYGNSMIEWKKNQIYPWQMNCSGQNWTRSIWYHVGSTSGSLLFLLEFQYFSYYFSIRCPWKINMHVLFWCFRRERNPHFTISVVVLFLCRLFLSLPPHRESNLVKLDEVFSIMGKSDLRLVWYLLLIEKLIWN